MIGIVDGDREVTWSDVEARARGVADGLRLEPGSRFALDAPTSIAAALAILAADVSGATVVPIHPRLTEIEKLDLVARARVDRVVTAADVDVDRWSASTDRIVDASAPLAGVFTSGTTGAPKLALLSRRAFHASAKASANRLAISERDRWLACMPLCHVGGLSILTRARALRFAVVLVARFDPHVVLEAAKRQRATMLSVVPTMLRALLEADRDDALATLRAILVGGAACPPELLDECAKRRVAALTTYGLTEACSQVTLQAPRDPSAREQGSGAPLEGTEVSVAGDRILVRGPTLFDGYERADGSIDRARDDAGFFDTGDVGELDELGRLHVRARRGDLIVTGGENVYPVEIEHVLESLLGVRRALVFGVADARWGEVVACALELDGVCDAIEVLRAAAERLAPHKRPRMAKVVARLPLTSAGKLARDASWIVGDAGGRWVRLG